MCNLYRMTNSVDEVARLFGGTATGARPFQVATANAQGQPATIAYAGSTDRARVLVGPGHTAATKYVGSAL